MKLYNSLTKQVENFEPLKSRGVSIYSCGPTVYDHIHIGNLSAFIYADTLRRVIKLAGHEVKHIMNLTDVDDKTIRRSQEKYPNLPAMEALHKMTGEYTEIFLNDMRAVGNDVKAYEFTKATDYIEQMQQLIRELYYKGFAYVADDGIYFSITKYKESGKVYGQLVEITDGSSSEARIQNDEYDKDNAHDFALWKKQKDGEPAWDFEIDGQDMKGRPGWHIECSAMSATKLGQPFDIHTGGVDLKFPHHENEIAQSTAGKASTKLANVFMHNEHILVDGQKMSKSLNNFYTLDDVKKKFDEPLAFRLLVLQSHYQNQAHFTWENLMAAYIRLTDLRKLGQLQHQNNLIWNTGPRVTEQKIDELKVELIESLENNLNLPEFLAKLSNVETIIKRDKLADNAAFKAFKNLIVFIDEVTGLKISEEPDISDEAKNLIREQDRLWKEAKRSNNPDIFIESDNIREKLSDKHIIVSNYNDGNALWSRYDQN